MKKTLGIDLGSNSAGWAIRNLDLRDNQIEDFGVITFEKGVTKEPLKVVGRVEDGTIEVIEYNDRIFGVQFHPESVLTQGGYQMLGNWLESIGLKGAATKAKGLNPLVNL